MKKCTKIGRIIIPRKNGSIHSDADEKVIAKRRQIGKNLFLELVEILLIARGYIIITFFHA